MGDKKYSGNFYKTDKIEETLGDCSNCLYRSKRAERNPDERPNRYYIPNEERREGQEQPYSVEDGKR